MNINEIAQMAGVSRATVSRYLNDGYVSAEKRARIQKVIEETSYQPSSQAQMLRTKRTKQVGIIIPQINLESISRMISGITVVLREAGFQMLLANAEHNESEELKYLKLFAENQVDGIIMFATAVTAEHKRALKALQVPAVILGQQMEGYSCVYQDDYNASKEAARMLLEAGAARIGYIGVTQKNQAVGRLRKQGFLDVLRENGIHWDESLYEECGFSAEEGYQAAEALLARHPDLQAVFGATDTIALGAMSRILESGRRVPEEVAIAGIGDLIIGKLIRPGLSSVHYYYNATGQEAARLLLELMNGSSAGKEVKMGYRVQPRGTTRQTAKELSGAPDRG